MYNNANKREELTHLSVFFDPTNEIKKGKAVFKSTKTRRTLPVAG
jgi:hypothetical protein